MIFDRLPLSMAEGAILAHAVDAGPLGRLKKGQVLDTEMLACLAKAGHETVLAARLEADDIAEDDAARLLSEQFNGDHVSVAPPFTGRANLHAKQAGVARINRELINKINTIDQSVTVATVRHMEKVEAGQMLATVKIIPFAAHRAHLDRATKFCGSARDKLVTVSPFTPKKIGLVSTRLPGTTDKTIEKSVRVLSDRLDQCGNSLYRHMVIPHHETELAPALKTLEQEGCDLILVFGASAITDIRDVIPRALEESGGTVLHFGMPVDPGNLLLLGELDKATVVGLPGCTRSPKLNGFDWVLQRLLADIPVGAQDIMEMGEGGLLKEIPSRPQPRDGTRRRHTGGQPLKIAGLILAAGQSRRMGPENKLLALIDGKPMIRHVTEQVLAARVDKTLLVCGHEAEAIRKSVWDLGVDCADNPDYADGLSTSLKTGFQKLAGDHDGILVCLGDMPLVSADILNRLIDAFNPDEGRAIIVPTIKGKRGNPVLISSQLQNQISEITGDIGAKQLILNNEDVVHSVEIDSDGIFIDIDTPDMLSLVSKKKK
ncbi:NTP transferase domain-containing protein [Sneathiella chinensis]|uniref:4-diphosphocytidyl-2C-methyl-D-erythritol kinase n=1 Tax=Sneathiella chinensis TaxID=349750 RepID=A0ABQ5U5N8_9PROT|nr:molybdopterin-binding/glycosyltransferase family 2 protein [Sneathiella chinensis]GLQ07081.1 4-diphosphocytidyl-2C-methyl-D-erythritol kinase [Sneathiella chinensis]